MLDRTIVLLCAPPLLRKRQYEQWRRAIGIGAEKGSMKRAAGYLFPCFVCGEQGILGVDGFGSKGLIRPRNIMHETCYAELPQETKDLYSHRDRKHIQRRKHRRVSRASLNRVASKGE